MILSCKILYMYKANMWKFLPCFFYFRGYMTYLLNSWLRMLLLNVSALNTIRNLFTINAAHLLDKYLYLHSILLCVYTCNTSFHGKMLQMSELSNEWIRIINNLHDK